jgi:hypothetical protein
MSEVPLYLTWLAISLNNSITSCFMIEDLGFMVRGFGLSVSGWGEGFSVEGSGFRV